jgi:hypothetical protein
MTEKTETPVRIATGPEAAALTWTSAILGGEITVERGLREGGSDMAWVAPTIADQGRPDLTGDLLAERREAFLQAALSRLDSR